MEQIVLLLMHSQMTLHFNSLNYLVTADYVFLTFIIPSLETQAVYSLSVKMESLTSRKKKYNQKNWHIFKIWVSPLGRFQAAWWQAPCKLVKGTRRYQSQCWRKGAGGGAKREVCSYSQETSQKIRPWPQLCSRFRENYNLCSQLLGLFYSKANTMFQK